MYKYYIHVALRIKDNIKVEITILEQPCKD